MENSHEVIARFVNNETYKINNDLSRMRIKHKRNKHWALWPPTRTWGQSYRKFWNQNEQGNLLYEVLETVQERLRNMWPPSVDLDSFATDQKHLERDILADLGPRLLQTIAYPKATVQ